MSRSLLFALGLGLACLPPVARGSEWPQFRGPGGVGLPAEKELPVAWSEMNVQWKVKVPGTGWSSPILWGDKIFLTSAVTENQAKPRPDGGPRGGGGANPANAVYRWEVYCLDRTTGKELWKQLASEGKASIPTHASNTYASETPVTDGERVYVYFGMTGLFCYDTGGKLLWKKDLGTYPMQGNWGTGSSPVLWENRLFLQCDNEEKSFLVALDKKTGAELWRVSRDEKSNWATPYVWKNKLRTELVTSASQKVRSYDPATGRLLWELGIGGGRCIATPVGDDELLYGGSEPFRSSGSLFAVRAGASGDITLKAGETANAGVAWFDAKGGLGMASPLLYQGHIYVLDRRLGIVSCYAARTGKPVYKERLPSARGFWASPWAYDGKVFCLDDDGQTFVLQAGPEFKLLGKNALPDRFWATPAAAGGALYLRGVEALYCVKP
jgi:outer membrane protein assembly factor BamB